MYNTDNLLQIRVVNTFGTLLETTAHSVIVPGASGDIGINNSPRVLVYLLRPGLIKLFDKNSNLLGSYFIFNGRFSAKEAHLLITTEYDLLKEDSVTKELVEQRLSKAREELARAEEQDKQYFQKVLKQEERLAAAFNYN